MSSEPASIARIHLLGATVRAYGAGAAVVKPWTRTSDFFRFWRVAP